MIIDFPRQIQYAHDGSETTEDSMILELTLVAGSDYTLPGYLQGSLRFPLHVNVTPVNDPPLLEIPTAKVLRLAQVRHRNKLHESCFQFGLSRLLHEGYIFPPRVPAITR
jgi:hypothetical protein